MNILVIGAGGREHSLGIALKRSPQCGTLYFAPGNAGTSFLGKNVDIRDTDSEALLGFAIENNISSCNFLYVDPIWCPLIEAQQSAKWLNQHSIWLSNGEENFSEYLARFNANQRRNIKRDAREYLKFTKKEKEKII